MPFTPTDYLPYDFANRRHIGPSPSEMEEMFKTIGVGSLDELINQTIPESIRQKDALANISTHGVTQGFSMSAIWDRSF